MAEAGKQIEFSAYCVLYGKLSEPHVYRGQQVRDRVAPGAFAASLRRVPVVLEHDEGRIIADEVPLIAYRRGIWFACRASILPDPILGLSIQYAKARWKRDGDVWTLLDGEIEHVSIQTAQPPHFRATRSTCTLDGLRVARAGRTGRKGQSP